MTNRPLRGVATKGTIPKNWWYIDIGTKLNSYQKSKIFLTSYRTKVCCNCSQYVRGIIIFEEQMGKKLTYHLESISNTSSKHTHKQENQQCSAWNRLNTLICVPSAGMSGAWVIWQWLLNQWPHLRLSTSVQLSFCTMGWTRMGLHS